MLELEMLEKRKCILSSNLLQLRLTSFDRGELGPEEVEAARSRNMMPRSLRFSARSSSRWNWI